MAGVHATKADRDAQNADEEYKKREKEASKSNDKLFMEAEHISARLMSEKAQLESIKSEKERTSQEVRSAQDTLMATQQDA